ncbi:hypothetical protein BGZ65_001301 [Modicella reniformis]|uniref:Uncharacterized protein n=1 Tax=Modicella reniformis TaxID=1440133 RepID=A0A9P6J1T2_9FUNG|nr:hypothetical protein BGZ65_001301 [Modicella reniformis]
MGNVPEYELVFLNELHEKLKRLNPKKTPFAGLYRILGRLIEYDLSSQIAKVESCFHREYTRSAPAEAPAVAAVAVAAAAAAASDKTVKKEKPLIKAGSDHYPPNHDVIDLTLEDDEIEPAELEFMDDENKNETKAEEDDDDEYEGQQEKESKVTPTVYCEIIDLTPNDEDVESPGATQCESIDNKPRWKGEYGPRKRASAPPPPSPSPSPMKILRQPILSNFQQKVVGERKIITTVQKKAPKIILWIDTQLLAPQKYELRALFQFIGEVVNVDGHWILQARTCRNMEGLDLYNYRQSILLTRELMQQYQVNREPDSVTSSEFKR